ncbi:sigma-70 family RNA polymerase sigma factor [Luteolibacter sp. LG18]|uniref:RNA polymerase sigma factor n=1 Tax=Luteolibacter sp. LG18 TaxID=2819286 RepID=UPI0030C73BC8
MTPDDAALLQHFATSGDEAAFRALVQRHLPLVHTVARRVTANGELARDVSQETFIRLARQAGSIPASVPLVTWLHRTARSLAANVVRAEVRRKRRESAAVDLSGEGTEAWRHLSPVIDALVDRLPATDRHLILLRFYEGLPHATTASRLGLNEAAARRRTLRALDKLRVLLARRGITTTAAVLGTALPAHAVASIPAGLAAPVASAAIASQGTAPGLGILKLMTLNQTAKTSVAVVILILLIGGIVYRVAPASAPDRDVSPRDRDGGITADATWAGEDVPPPPAARPKRPELVKKPDDRVLETRPGDIASKVETRLAAGSSLVMGGQLTAAGLREFVVLSPEWTTTDEGTKAILIRSKMITLDAKAVAAAGLDTLTTDQRQVQQNGEIWSAEDLSATLGALGKEDQAGSQVVAAPNVTTGSNQTCVIVVGTSEEFIKLDLVISGTDDGGFDVKSDILRRE